MEQELLDYIALVPSIANPMALAVCSFKPNLGNGDEIVKTAARAMTIFNIISNRKQYLGGLLNVNKIYTSISDVRLP
jgi:hypothetical protein